MGVLHNEINFFLCLYNLEQANYVRMRNCFQNADLTGDSLDVRGLGDAVLIEDFDGYLLLDETVGGQLYLAKCTLSQSFA